MHGFTLVRPSYKSKKAVNQLRFFSVQEDGSVNVFKLTVGQSKAVE